MVMVPVLLIVRWAAMWDCLKGRLIMLNLILLFPLSEIFARISYSGFLIQMLTLFVTPMLMRMVKLMLILGQMEPVMVEVQRPSREEPRVEGRMVKVGFISL